ncbi:FCD domain-containing protein [Streptomyces sp. NPDC020951]
MARLASAHASPGDLSELQDMVEEMDHMPSWAEFHGGDERFHRCSSA